MVAINLLELPLNSHLKWFLWPTSEAGRPSSNSRVSSPNTARCGKVPKGKSAVSGALQPLHVQAPITDPPPLSMKLVIYSDDMSQLSYL